MVLTAHRIQDIHIHKEHEVVVNHLGCPDGLQETEASSAPDIVRPRFSPRGLAGVAAAEPTCGSGRRHGRGVE